MRQSQNDSGVLLPESRQQVRQIQHTEGLDGADVQLPVQHAADSGDRIAPVVNGGQCLRAAGSSARPA